MIKKFLKRFGILTGSIFVILEIVSIIKKKDSVYANEPDQQNPMEGKRVIFVQNQKDPENADGIRGHLEVKGETNYKKGIYEKYIKRGLDIVLSFGGLIVLSPILLGVSIAIYIDDPGPIFFTQKRLGQNKKYFKLHKFRTMKMSTPHDVPTHQLENPEQYITKVGSWIRRHSIDELAQLWDIFIGNMSVIGPRPGLWNQDLLTAERDKYKANDVKPGLTGWAQINGRDELEIPEKARLDGEYVKEMGLRMDAKCFLGSLGVFAHDDSVVEGGTGELKKIDRCYTEGKTKKELIGNIGFGGKVEVDKEQKKKVLITGAKSYIGQSFMKYAYKYYSNNFEIEELDLISENWKEKNFTNYDIVYHVAGIAHADVGNVSDEVKRKYYEVNTDLAVEVARKAKDEGVKEFIFMSSMIVYGDSAPYGKKKIVDENTVPEPSNFYGNSKMQADMAVRDMATEDFKVIVIRPPMIYGKESKGNYRTLATLVKKLPLFPDVENNRSMLFVGNLCEFLCQIMLVKEIKENAVVLIPQNKEWIKTSNMVRKIANVTERKVYVTKCLDPFIFIASKVPGKIGTLVNKAFGNSCYEPSMSKINGIKYQIYDFEKSISITERES
jgi:lipopolysaccharide/colanic/teichoic acid biosynthesis glycosyltransferase/nucleoside-diphosphate-sugar epimerase